jgi:hypothetical protein
MRSAGIVQSSSTERVMIIRAAVSLISCGVCVTLAAGPKVPLPLSSIRATEQMNCEDWKKIELNYCGTRVKDSYKISGKLVTVNFGSGIKTAQLGILPTEMLAHMLLRELEFERRETKRNTLCE